jgi:very-short-patch-repair endonuclease
MIRRRISTHRSELLAGRAQRMRHAATSSERALWNALLGKKLGASFKRQVPLGGRYVVDFLASQAKLAVEVDGTYRGARAGADARRHRALGRLGYRVLRLEAELVLRDLPAAVELVRQALAATK